MGKRLIALADELLLRPQDREALLDTIGWPYTPQRAGVIDEVAGRLGMHGKKLTVVVNRDGLLLSILIEDKT